MTDDRSKSQAGKISDLLKSLFRKPDLLGLVEDLAGVRLLRDVTKHPFPSVPREKWPDEGVKRMAILDTETTGFSPKDDKIIEIAVLIAHFHPDHGLLHVNDTAFRMFQDPGRPIDKKITDITGITDEMVKGKSIDQEALRGFTEECDYVLAHNAPFDLGFVTEHLKKSGLSEKHWMCSQDGVDWLETHGVSSAKQEILATHFGWCYPAHSAIGDVRALSFILTDRVAFKSLEESIHRPKYRLIAEESPFDRKDDLKGAGFKWAPGDGGEIGKGKKGWYIDLPDDPLERENVSAVLRDAYEKDVTLPVMKVPADKKYVPDSYLHADRDHFSTKTPDSLFESIDMSSIPSSNHSITM